MKRVMLVAVGLMFFAAGGYAQKYKPDFNQGLSLTEFLKAAQEMDSPQLYVPLSRIDGSVVKNFNPKEERLTSLSEKLPAPGQGYYFGPTGAWVTGSQAFKNGQIHASLLHGHEDPTAYYLLGEWEAIKADRVQLLATADIIDPKDHQLYLDGTASDENYKKLIIRIDTYNKRLAAYKENCKSGPETNPDCAAEYKWLIKEHNDLLTAIDQHNANVAQLKQRYAALKNDVNIFDKAVRDWETVIGYFITSVKAYLDGQVMCFLEEELHQEVWIGNPPKKYYATGCYYICTNNYPWSFIWYSEFAYYNCPKSVNEGVTPPAPVPNLRPSPDFSSPKPMAKFK